MAAILISSYPVELVLVTGGKGALQRRQATLRVRNIRDHSIDHRVNARDERALGLGPRADHEHLTRRDACTAQ